MLALNEHQRISWGQNLHRIGVPKDGSCFFHALLLETDPTYRTLSLEAKQEAATRLRKQVAESLTIKDFHTLSNNGSPLYRDLPERVARYRKENYVINPSEVEQISRDLEKYADQLTLPTASAVKIFLQNFLAFREYIRNPGEAVGEELHLLVSQLLKVDVYLTTTQEDGTIGYIFHDPERSYQGRQSVIVHKVPGKEHWEAVGQFGEQGLVTLFESDASVILQLRKCFEEHWKRVQS